MSMDTSQYIYDLNVVTMSNMASICSLLQIVTDRTSGLISKLSGVCYVSVECLTLPLDQYNMQSQHIPSQ